MKKLIMIPLLVVAMFLAGCQSTGPRESVGILSGAALGGLVGNQFGGGTGKAVATTVGVFVGGMVGREIGAQMDAQDRALLYRTTQTALDSAPSGTRMPWHNEQSGNSGFVQPTKTYEVAPGRYCREYQHRVRVAGSIQQSYGTACRQPDGTWEIQ